MNCKEQEPIRVLFQAPRGERKVARARARAREDSRGGAEVRDGLRVLISWMWSVEKEKGSRGEPEGWGFSTRLDSMAT